MIPKWFGILLVVGMSLTSCSRGARDTSTEGLPLNWDGGLLSGKPCTAPCFADIIPGITSETEAVRIYQSNPDWFRDCKTFDQPNQGRGITCQGMVISLQENGDVVDGIGFRTAQPIKVGDVIARYGEPTTVLVTLDGVPEHPYTMMLVYFDQIKVRLVLERQEGVDYRVSESDEVETGMYYSTGSAGIDTSTGDSWHGYGMYAVSSTSK